MGSETRTKEPRSSVAKAGRARNAPAARVNPAARAKAQVVAADPAGPDGRSAAAIPDAPASGSPERDRGEREQAASHADPPAGDALDTGRAGIPVRDAEPASDTVTIGRIPRTRGDDTVLLEPEQGAMEFAVTPRALGAGLAAVVAALPTRTTLPVLRQVMVRTEGDGHILLTATDLDTTITRRIPASVSEPGGALVSGQKLARIARELPDGCVIDVRLRAGSVHVSCKETRSRYRLPTVPLDEFPAVPRIAWEDHELVVSGDTLGLLVGRTAWAASTEDTRPILNGVLWERADGEMAMVATDGHRLSSTRIEAQGLTAQPEMILQRRALALLARTAAESVQVVVARTTNHVGFRGEDWELVTRTIEGPYPNYHMVLPKDNDKALTVDRSAFAAAIRRMAILASTETHRIKLALGDPTTLRISVETPDLGSAHEDVSVEYQGDPLEIGFNALYLLEVLRFLPAGDVSLTFKAPDRAATIQPVADETGAATLMLVMPLRLQG